MSLVLEDFLIGEENMQRLAYVDLVIAGWPHQGHPAACVGRGWDNRNSTQVTELMKTLDWWFQYQTTILNIAYLSDTRDKLVSDARCLDHLLDEHVVLDTGSRHYTHLLHGCRPIWHHITIWYNIVTFDDTFGVSS